MCGVVGIYSKIKKYLKNYTILYILCSIEVKKVVVLLLSDGDRYKLQKRIWD